MAETVSNRGQRRLAKWRTQAPFDVGNWFTRRLTKDEVSQEELVALLSEGPEAIAEHQSEIPAWLHTLMGAFLGQEAECMKIPLPARWQRHPGRSFWCVIEPLVRDAHARLMRRIRALVEEGSAPPLDVDALRTAVLFNLPASLLRFPLRTWVLELHVARAQGQLEGLSSEERFAHFSARLQEPHVALGLFAEYPVLARQLVTLTEAWSDATLELLERLVQDWSSLRQVFPEASTAGPVVTISGGAGDGHRGGRSVTVLTFQSGWRLVYKPRPLAVEARFQRLLQEINGWGTILSFRPLTLLDRGNHGWSEFVSARPCSTTEEVRRFYRRQGSYLAVLHMLRATDLHFENVIANGEYPVLVDLESLLHPDVGQPPSVKEDFIHESVLRVGLLPIRLWSHDDSPGVDLSGLGALAGQVAPRSVLYWAAPGTDQMHLARRPREVQVKGDHRPTLEGRAVSPCEYTEELVSGFTTGYRALLAHRDELMAEGGLLAGLAGDPVRVLLRATQLYGLLLEESSHPDFLRDALERDRFLDKLWVQVPEQPWLESVVHAEHADLRRGDIPFFFTRPDSRDLWTGEGDRIHDFFALSAMDSVRCRFKRFGERDLARQTWLIRASLSLLEVGGDSHSSGSMPKARAFRASPSPEQLLQTAVRVGDRLSELALEEGDGTSWLGLTRTHGAYAIAPLGADLYEGVPGVALFLAWLGHVTGHSRFTILARGACRTLLHQMETAIPQAVGAFQGIGGILYTLIHLSRLWKDPSLHGQAILLLRELPHLIERDEKLDVVGGVAGCVPGLTALLSSGPSELALNLVRRCGERLLAQARPMARGLAWTTTGEADIPLTGFSHGAAGIAASLFEVASWTGDGRFHRAAMAALAYEHSLFSPAHGNWPDFRMPSSCHAQFNWCHGAPGIGLARLSALRHFDDGQLRSDVELAVWSTLIRGVDHDNHSLCHGQLGSIELLQAAQSKFPDLRLEADIGSLSAQLLDEINAQGGRCGLPISGAEIPGFMEGLAGIGYGLLRLAVPTIVPSVLMLEAPFGHKGAHP